LGEVPVYNKSHKTIHFREGGIPVDVFEPMLADIKTDFVERKLNAKVVDSNFYEELFIFIGKDFLDMFQVRDGVVVAGELLSPCWGKYLDDNLDGLPYWMAEVKYKTVNKDRITECLEKMDKAMDRHDRRIRN
jgi:hypothetical protein